MLDWKGGWDGNLVPRCDTVHTAVIHAESRLIGPSVQRRQYEKDSCGRRPDERDSNIHTGKIFWKIDSMSCYVRLRKLYRTGALECRQGGWNSSISLLALGTKMQEQKKNVWHLTCFRTVLCRDLDQHRRLQRLPPVYLTTSFRLARYAWAFLSIYWWSVCVAQSRFLSISCTAFMSHYIFSHWLSILNLLHITFFRLLQLFFRHPLHIVPNNDL